jgi:hypothetical protein
MNQLPRMFDGVTSNCFPLSLSRAQSAEMAGSLPCRRKGLRLSSFTTRRLSTRAITVSSAG